MEAGVAAFDATLVVSAPGPRASLGCCSLGSECLNSPLNRPLCRTPSRGSSYQLFLM